MYLLRTFKVALAALAANKLRSVLAVLGIVIAVVALITMTAMGKGAQASVEASMNRMGVNLVFIEPGTMSRGSSMARTMMAETLTLEDAQAVEKLPNVAAVAPEIRRSYQVKHLAKNKYARVVGTTPSHLVVRNFTVEKGAYFDKAAIQGRLRVAVLGAQIARDLFEDLDPVGRTIQIDRKNFEVVGVLADKGGDSWLGLDESVYVPVTTALYRLGNRRFLSQITLTIDVPENVQAAVTRVESAMMKLHKLPATAEPDFRVNSMSEYLQSRQEATEAFNLLLACVAAVSLLVGGIGIMNIMLVSVTERTREIGIRKAVGARRSDILKQFLIESMTISLMGGILGILLGITFARFVPKLPIWRSLNFTRGSVEWESVISAEWTAVAFAISCVVGIIFGVYPAMKAARMNPVDALRYE